MKSIKLSSRTNEDWSGKRVTEQFVEHWIDGEGEVFKPDGTLLCRVAKKALKKEILADAWTVLDSLSLITTNRGAASGLKKAPLVRKDGTLSSTTKTPAEHKIKSGVIGYFDRSPRRPFCRPCSWNHDNPEKWARVVPLFQNISQVFQEYVPDRFEAQAAFIQKIHPDFRIPGTVFTTVTVNKNFRTACHKDAGDLEEGFGVMVLIREGMFKGGSLIFPDFKVGVRYDTGDVCFADVHEFHGNSAIVGVTKEFQRCTLVCYARTKMIQCGSASQELEFARSWLGGSLALSINDS